MCLLSADIHDRKAFCPLCFEHFCAFYVFLVFNCPEFEIPAGFVADITEDGIVIFCQISPHQFWEMKCISGEWVPKLNITCLAGPSTLQPLPTGSCKMQCHL